MIFQKNHVKVFTLDHDTYIAMAFDGKYGVYNCCYGTTQEKEKEMALLKLKKC
jgi:hypothetical protein